MKDITKIEFAGMPLIAKKDPIYKSEIFGVPAWVLGVFIMAFNLQQRHKLF